MFRKNIGKIEKLNAFQHFMSFLPHLFIQAVAAKQIFANNLKLFWPINIAHEIRA